MAKKNAIKEKSVVFGREIIQICSAPGNKGILSPIYDQLLRSSTSVGAMLCEAEFAESKKDFLHKLKISLKEINESIHWLDMLQSASAINEDAYTPALAHAKEIKYILIAIIKTTENNMKIEAASRKN